MIMESLIELLINLILIFTAVYILNKKANK